MRDLQETDADLKWSALQRGSSSSFVVGPHSQHPDNALFGEDLIDDSMLNVDSAGTGASQVPDQLLEWRRILASRPLLAELLQASLLQILRAHQNTKFAIGLEVEKEGL